MNTNHAWLPLAILFSFSLFLLPRPAAAADESTFGIDHRIPWTTSKVWGSPDPPLPYSMARTFTNLTWKSPIFLIAEPGTESLLLVQQGGEKDRPSRLFRFSDDPAASHADPFLEISNRLVYSVVFHPGYQTNGYLFLFSNGPTPERDRTNRISRFTVARTTPFECDSKSEQVIIEWPSAGHDGGGIVFGHDGMLYISSGDGTSDSDGWVTGQDISDLNGGVLRIDVDHPQPGRQYSVPNDNPFVRWKGARPELWAYGLRNPWRMSIDAKTGQIWAGNNGQDLWESAHLIRRGENYGWSVYEGSHPFYLNRKLGPTPPVAPTVEHSHSEMRSLTGGVVYYGPGNSAAENLPELDGVYVYGDYSTGKIWGVRHDGKRVTWHRPLAESQLQITAFALDHHGRLLVVDHAGGLYQLVRTPQTAARPAFPRRLSETGLFLSTREHRVDPGLIPYSVNASGWADGAQIERFIGLPENSKIDYTSSGSWNFSDGAVLMQTLSLERQPGIATSKQRVETRLLTRQGGQWAGYSYRWNEDQSDAELVEASGADNQLNPSPTSDSANPARKTAWHFPSRAECMACHSRAANFVLGLSELQMNKSHPYAAAADNQLHTLEHIGVFKGPLPKNLAALPKLANPYDPLQPLDARARSYLHANCSVCHVEAGGGNSKMELGFGTAPERMNIFGARPQHDTFGIDNAMLIFPGDPERSILYQRISRRGPGQMPPVASRVVDDRAVELFRDWIRAMPPQQQFVREWTMQDLLPKLSEVNPARSVESGRAIFTKAGCIQCHRFAGDGGSVGPDLTAVGKRLKLPEILESILLPSKVIAEGYATTQIELVSGQTLSGHVEREDADVLVVRPLSATENPVTIRKKDVRQRALSKVSNMPGGIANSLQESEILDLLAYVAGVSGHNHSTAQSQNPAAPPKN